MKKPIPTALLVCATIVLVVTILTLAALIASGAETDEIATLTGFLGLLVVQGIALVRGEAVKATVDDLANGRMDSKIRAGVADVLKPHLIDPEVEPQIEADRERRAEHS